VGGDRLSSVMGFSAGEGIGVVCLGTGSGWFGKAGSGGFSQNRNLNSFQVFPVGWGGVVLLVMAGIVVVDAGWSCGWVVVTLWFSGVLEQVWVGIGLCLH